MANISSAEGHFTFGPEFVEKHSDVIQTWIDNHKSSYYGFDLDDNELDSDGSIAFHASGHWTYADTLREEGIGWTNAIGPESNKAVKELARALAKEKSVVCVNFTDYESGCEVFYEEKAVLRYKSDKEFEVVVSSYEDIPYNLENLVEKGFEEAAYDFSDAGDQEAFREYVEINYSKAIGECYKSCPIAGVDAFCNKFFAEVLKDEYHKGLVLDWEIQDFDCLCEIGGIRPAA